MGHPFTHQQIEAMSDLTLDGTLSGAIGAIEAYHDANDPNGNSPLPWWSIPAYWEQIRIRVMHMLDPDNLPTFLPPRVCRVASVGQAAHALVDASYDTNKTPRENAETLMKAINDNTEIGET